jgi:hypothetical protein
MSIDVTILNELKDLRYQAEQVYKKATSLIEELEGEGGKKKTPSPKRTRRMEIEGSVTKRHNQLRKAV